MARRRGRGEGSIYQRSIDGRWVGVLNLGVINGKRKRKIIYRHTRKAAALALTQAARDNYLTSVDSAGITVAGWLDWWLENMASEALKPLSVVSYRSRIETLLKPGLGNHRLDKLSPEHVIAFQRDMRNRNLALATRRHSHTVLKMALRDAMRMEKVRRNVCDLIDPPKGEKARRPALELGDAQAVLAAADATERPARWYAALWLGMRQSEALALTWADVDLDAGTLDINKALHRIDGELVLGPPKWSSQRVVPLHPIIGSRLAVEYARHRNAGGADEAPCWPRDDGTHMSPQTDWAQWRDLLVAAQVPHVPLHAARETAASLLMAAGVPDRVTADILGHSQVRQTHDYQRGDPAQYAAAFVALDRYMSPTALEA